MSEKVSIAAQLEKNKESPMESMKEINKAVFKGSDNVNRSVLKYTKDTMTDGTIYETYEGESEDVIKLIQELNR